MAISDWNQDKDQREAEGLAADIIKKLYKCEVIDVSGDKAYQEIDTDLVAKGAYKENNNADLSFEVKNCSEIHKTGNIYVEITHFGYSSDPYRIEEGWYNKSKANCIMYRSSYNKLFLWFRLDDLKRYICEHFVKENVAKDIDKTSGALIKKKLAYLVPVKHFIEWSKGAVVILDENGEAVSPETFTTEKTYVPNKRFGVD